jgi:hypothetical protein
LRPSTAVRHRLLSERVAAHYHEFPRENFGGNVIGENVEECLKDIRELPEDTGAWELGEPR